MQYCRVSTELGLELYYSYIIINPLNGYIEVYAP